MAGVLLIALGAARLGGTIKFIPHPRGGSTARAAIVLLTDGLHRHPGNVFDSFDDAMVRASEVASFARGVTGGHATAATGAGH